MNKFSMLTVWLCVLVLIPAAVAPAAGQTPSHPRVVLISIDGLRPDALDLAETLTLDELIATGSYHPMVLNELPSATMTNHASMLTGLSSLHHGLLLDIALPGRIPSTTIFDLAHAAGLRTGFFVSKDKLAYLAGQAETDVRVIDPDTDALLDQLVLAIETQDLDLIFLHLGQTDSVGHRYGWMSSQYLAAVAHADQQIARLVEALDSAGLLDQTVIIVTADHGGLGNCHALNLPVNRLIPLIINGPGIAAGRTLCQPLHQYDTAATILWLLSLAVPDDWDGQPVLEAAAETIQPTCQPQPPPVGPPCMVLPLLLLACTFLLICHGRRRALRAG
ncbi:MAG: alkaline phosphatase family protein [Phycisphaerae bacterium]